MKNYSKNVRAIGTTINEDIRDVPISGTGNFCHANSSKLASRLFQTLLTGYPGMGGFPAGDWFKPYEEFSTLDNQEPPHRQLERSS